MFHFTFFAAELKIKQKSIEIKLQERQWNSSCQNGAKKIVCMVPNWIWIESPFKLWQSQDTDTKIVGFFFFLENVTSEKL